MLLSSAKNSKKTLMPSIPYEGITNWPQTNNNYLYGLNIYYGPHFKIFSLTYSPAGGTIPGTASFLYRLEQQNKPDFAKGHGTFL
jgi:hypothetical protein